MAVLALITGALLIRLMVPAGWMAVRDAGGLHLTLCTGSGAMPMPEMAGMAHAAAPKDHHADDPAPADHVCPFAVSALQLALPVLPLLLPPIVAAFAIGPVAAYLTGIGHGLAAPPPPSTGPPTST